MIAIDTNLLIYAHRAGVPEHHAARQAIQGASEDPRGWGIPFPCIAEFWSVVTHPACVGGPSPPHRALAFVRALTAQAGGQVWMPQAGLWERLLRLAGDIGVAGARIFDLQIALTAVENGATELWTHDAGFVRVRGLQIRNPL